MDDVCAPGYRGRKRGQVVRTRTVVSQAHSFQWLGSFGNRGNGRYREELRKALAAITRYLTAHQLPSERALLRLDGQYGTGSVLSDLAGFAFVTRGKEYTVLDHPLVPLSLSSQTKTENRTRTAGAATRPGARKPGRWCPNGSGISGSNWGINWNQRPCASPSLLPPSHSRTSKLPRVQSLSRLRLDMVH